MSSFLRRIQRTLKINDEGNVVQRRRKAFNGRGTKLGVTNPKDPCRTGKTKVRKAWRGKGDAPVARPKIGVAAIHATIDRVARLAAHKAKMAFKAGKSFGPRLGLLGVPAGVNRRTGELHNHARSIARQLRREG